MKRVLVLMGAMAMMLSILAVSPAEAGVVVDPVTVNLNQAGNLIITGDDNANNIRIESAGGLNYLVDTGPAQYLVGPVTRNVHVFLKGGDDTFHAIGAEFPKALRVSGLGGDDFISLYDVLVRGAATLDGGTASGTSTLERNCIVVDHSTFLQNAFIRGAAGADGVLLNSFGGFSGADGHGNPCADGPQPPDGFGGTNVFEKRLLISTGPGESEVDINGTVMGSFVHSGGSDNDNLYVGLDSDLGKRPRSSTYGGDDQVTFSARWTQKAIIRTAGGVDEVVLRRPRAPQQLFDINTGAGKDNVHISVAYSQASKANGGAHNNDTLCDESGVDHRNFENVNVNCFV